MLSVAKVLEASTLPYFYQSWKQVRYTIYHINLPISQWNINFIKRLCIPSSFPKKSSALHRSGSREHSLSNTFLNLRMGQVFNISNKHQLFNKSAKNIISAKRLHIPLSFPKQLVSFRGVFRTLLNISFLRKYLMVESH